MSHPNTFSYLGNQIMTNTLDDFADMFTKYMSSEVEKFPELKERLSAYKGKSNVLQKEVIKTFICRNAPCYTQGKIIRLNQLWVHLITDINDSRKDKMKQIESAISRWKDQLVLVEDRQQDALLNRDKPCY